MDSTLVSPPATSTSVALDRLEAVTAQRWPRAGDRVDRGAEVHRLRGGRESNLWAPVLSMAGSVGISVWTPADALGTRPPRTA